MLVSQNISTGISIPTSQVGKSGSTVLNKADPRARETAKEFESTILSMLLKQMRESLEPDTLFPGDSADVQGGLFDMYLGRHLAEAGGIGLANVMMRQLQPAAGATNPQSQLDATRFASPAALDALARTPGS